MEKIAKKCCYSIAIILLFTPKAFAQRIDKTIIAKVENRFENNNLVQYYINEQPNIDYFTFSLEDMEINPQALHIYFFSEVDDIFQFYINNQKVKTESVNTLGYDGSGKDPVVSIAFPSGNDEFILKVVSMKYGSLETKSKREYPMIYLHHDTNEWYITHTDAYRLPYKYFTRDFKN